MTRYQDMLYSNCQIIIIIWHARAVRSYSLNKENVMGSVEHTTRARRLFNGKCTEIICKHFVAQISYLHSALCCRANLFLCSTVLCFKFYGRLEIIN